MPLPITGVPVTAGQPTAVTGTIANAGSLSGAVGISGKMVGIILPAAWTSASVTFSVSQDGTTYYDLYDDATERAIPSASVVASRFMSVDLNDWLCVNFVKFRSGSSATPVSQGADRVFTAILAG